MTRVFIAVGIAAVATVILAGAVIFSKRGGEDLIEDAEAIVNDVRKDTLSGAIKL